MPPPFLIIVVGVVVVIVLGVLSHLGEKKRRLALEQWARQRGLRFRPEKDRDMEDRYPVFSALRDGSNRYAHNILHGARHGRSLCGFDYHYETYSTDSKGNRTTHHHRFSALVVNSGLPLRPLLIRPEGMFDKVTEFLGFDDIDFELGEFSRTFFVKAPERRWAFDVLHQETMEFLLHAPRFTVEFGGPWVLVRRKTRFAPDEFADALGVAEGVLDRLPEYLLRQLRGVDA